MLLSFYPRDKGHKLDTQQETRKMTPVEEFNENVRLMEEDFEAYAEKFIRRPQIQDYLEKPRTKIGVAIDRILGITW